MMLVKVRSRIYCIVWLILHGFIPKRYHWFRKFGKKTSHLFFSYGKYKLCGKIWPAEKWLKETYTVNLVWDMPTGLITEIGGPE